MIFSAIRNEGRFQFVGIFSKTNYIYKWRPESVSLNPLIGEREEVNTNFITRTDLSCFTLALHSCPDPDYKKYVPVTIIPLIILLLLLPDVIPATIQPPIFFFSRRSLMTVLISDDDVGN